LQLLDVFPVLGLVIYCPWEHGLDRTADAVNMVERGARLNQIASFMDIPMWTRKLKPAVADLFRYVPDNLHCYLPEKTWEQRLWLRAVMSKAYRNPDFTYWIARNVLKIGGRIDSVFDLLSNVNDWVMEAKREKPRCITRPFSPDMSVNTVRTESELWHEAIAKCKVPKSKYKIPAPWYPAGQVNGYRIVPLDNAEKLWKEGRAMHHCAGSYDYRVAAGDCYIYSVRRGNKRMATVELVRDQGKVRPRQMRAACNAKPPKAVRIAVMKWISELKAA
jgi:PcfJ-like protein